MSVMHDVLEMRKCELGKFLRPGWLIGRIGSQAWYASDPSLQDMNKLLLIGRRVTLYEYYVLWI